MIQNILVLGGGSAGFLAALTLKKRFPDMSVTVLRSRDIGIIGVGEGTTIPVANHLHGYLGIDFAAFYKEAQPTWKLGIRFVNWGTRPYFDFALGRQLDVTYPGMSRPVGYYVGDTLDCGACSALMSHNRVYPRRFDGVPYITRDAAYHIENELLVAFLEQHAQAMGVAIRDDTVLEVQQDDAGVTGLVLASGQTVSADLYLDCSGFRALLLGDALGEPLCSFAASLFCDRAVVGGWMRDDEPIKPYTTGEAMSAGWSWQIEHEGHVNRGYVYSSSFISDAAAEDEFRAKNPKLKNTRIVKFVSGRRQRAWVKNVVAIGNATGFVEPMEATALGMICLDAHALAEALADVDREIRPMTVRQYNIRFAVMWDVVRDFLALHYKFNTHLQTPFWKACVADTDLAGAQDFVDYYQETGPSTLWRNQVIDVRNPFGFEGYLSVMLGMDVPYRRTYTPTDQEMSIWKNLSRRFDTAARKGMTVPETLGVIRHPWWKWPGNVYSPGGHNAPVDALEIVYAGQCMGAES